MKDNNKKNLIIYRASAGSGKTFTLVSEYLALAIKGYLCNNNDFNDKVNSSFSKILAITFTNKATSEMKIRILNTLYDIAHNQTEGDWTICPVPLPFSERYRLHLATALRE